MERERDLQLKGGTNQVSFRESLKERGSHMYELLVESKDDTLAENNLLQGVVEVKGPPKVLLLSSQKESQRFLSRVLQVQGYSVVESSPEAQPLTLPELSSFDLLILDNVSAFQLSYGKMETIEKYVRDLGGGLLVIGGSQSYGAGGYYRTPFERILPVDMRPPGMEGYGSGRGGLLHRSRPWHNQLVFEPAYYVRRALKRTRCLRRAWPIPADSPAVRHPHRHGRTLQQPARMAAADLGTPDRLHPGACFTGGRFHALPQDRDPGRYWVDR